MSLHFDRHTDRRARITTLLTASAVGIYLLVLAGVSNALADAAGACPTWPACGGRLTTAFGPRLGIVLAHRLTALLVGGLLLVTAVTVIRHDSRTRIRAALGATLVLYPIEVWLGARTAVTGAPTAVASLHLVVAMGIFSALMAALVWHLDADVGPSARDADSITATPDTAVPDAPDAVAADASSEHVPGDREAGDGPDRGAVTRAKAYVRLTKPKLWWLLCLVALASMGLATGGVPPAGLVVATLSGGVLAIGASGTFNNVIERDRDERMARTDDRPVVTETISPRRALLFGGALTLASVAVFVAFVNVLAAVLGLLAIGYYSVVYTLVLKPHTDQNTVLGGAVGALPALIGWAAVTDSVGLPAVVLGGVVFLWTPAHFYNLALVYRDDYERAGFPMLPVVRGERTARRHIAGYLGATLLAAVALGTAPTLGTVYAAVAVVLGTVFLRAVVRLHRECTDDAALRAFLASNAYLGALLVAVVVDTMVV
ncbi:MAG: heme o synthase [Haloarculaceae archaeon]